MPKSKATREIAAEPLVKRSAPQPKVEATEELADVKGEQMSTPDASCAPTPKKSSKKGKESADDLNYKAVLTSQAVHNALGFYRMGVESPVADDEQLLERVGQFFDACADLAQLPTFEKLCLAIGCTKAEATAWENGTQRGFGSRTGEIIRQAKLALSAVEADLAMQGQIQPSVYQFRSKNFSGMKDQTETVVTPNAEPAAKSLSELLQTAKMLQSANQAPPIKVDYVDNSDK